MSGYFKGDYQAVAPPMWLLCGNRPEVRSEVQEGGCPVGSALWDLNTGVSDKVYNGTGFVSHGIKQTTEGSKPRFFVLLAFSVK